MNYLVKLAQIERQRKLVLSSLISEAAKAKLIAELEVQLKQLDAALNAAVDAPVQGAGGPVKAR